MAVAKHVIPTRAISADCLLCKMTKMTQEPFPRSVQLIRVPDLGAVSKSIQLVNWTVSTGESIIAGERVAELLIDSVLVHLESEVEGILSRYLVASGANVEIGQSIAEVTIEIELSDK